MAQEVREQGAAAAAKALDSLFYDASNMPNDLPAPARGLLRRGWKCQADNPRLENGLWLPPWGGDAKVHEAKVYGHVMRPSRDKNDADGNPLAEPHYEALKTQDGSLTGALTVDITQTVVQPASQWVNFHVAVRMQLARQAAEAMTRKEDKQPKLVPLPDAAKARAA